MVGLTRWSDGQMDSQRVGWMDDKIDNSHLGGNGHLYGLMVKGTNRCFVDCMNG